VNPRDFLADLAVLSLAPFLSAILAQLLDADQVARRIAEGAGADPVRSIGSTGLPVTC
jgi:hypothetical protein